MEANEAPDVHGQPGDRLGAPLDRARAAYREYQWDDAYRQFRATAADVPLQAADLASLADAVW